MGALVQEDTMVCNMPRIRITASKNQKAGRNIGGIKGLKSPSKQGSQPRGNVNLGGATNSLAYDAASAHHRFDKNYIGLRSMYKHLCISDQKQLLEKGNQN